MKLRSFDELLDLATHVKICLRSSHDDEQAMAEWLWAKPVADDPGWFVVDNTPVMITEVSLGDQICPIHVEREIEIELLDGSKWKEELSHLEWAPGDPIRKATEETKEISMEPSDDYIIHGARHYCDKCGVEWRDSDGGCDCPPLHLRNEVEIGYATGVNEGGTWYLTTVEVPDAVLEGGDEAILEYAKTVPTAFPHGVTISGMWVHHRN